jgi:hypothetical protein
MSSDAPISEGNMGTNAKHFNGMATARPDGMQPIFSCRSSDFQLQAFRCPIRYRAAARRVSVAAI